MKKFFLLALNVFVCHALFAQPKERLKNRYREPNMSYGAPYTMFDISDFTSNKSIGVTPAAARIPSRGFTFKK